MWSAKARARVRLEGAMEIVRTIPATAAFAAVKLGQGLQGAVVAFDTSAGALIGHLDIMHQAAGARLDLTREMFAAPDWAKVAEKSGEEFTVDGLRTCVAKSRELLGFTYLHFSTED